MVDVIIVGAGPGGSAAAIQLARQGWQVLLLEKHTFPRDKVCGDFISPRSQQVLANLGCLDQVAELGAHRISGGNLFVNGRQITSSTIPGRGGLPDYGYVLPRLIFDEIVFRQAQQSGATTIEGCTVKEIYFDQDGVTVEAVQDRRPVRFRGKMIIGADGVHSIVARKLKMAPQDSRSVIVALRAYFENVQNAEGMAELFFDDSFFPGYGWIFPLGGGRANVGIGMVRDVYQHYDINLRKAFDDWLERDANARACLSEARLEGRIVGWPLNTYRREACNFAPRALLVGDAGSFVDPINGEGIHTALETATIAAGVIDEALRASDFSAAFLSRYETRWRRALDLDLRTSDFIVSFIQNRALKPLFMQILEMIGEQAGRDAAYAATCGGVLAGVVPVHHSLGPDIVLKTVMHGSRFWGGNVRRASAGSLTGLLNVGLQAGSEALDMVGDMADEPGHMASWGINVTSKGVGLLRRLGNKYALGTARQLISGGSANAEPHPRITIVNMGEKNGSTTK
jgi:geranylgeranyl reductase family protein